MAEPNTIDLVDIELQGNWLTIDRERKLRAEHLAARAQWLVDFLDALEEGDMGIVAQDAWSEGDHPRGQPDNKGEFAKSPSGGGIVAKGGKPGAIVAKGTPAPKASAPTPGGVVVRGGSSQKPATAASEAPRGSESAYERGSREAQQMVGGAARQAEEDDYDFYQHDDLPGSTDIRPFYDRLAKKGGGFTYQPRIDSEPKTGFAVSIYPKDSFSKPAADFTANDLVDYLVAHKDMLSNPQVHVGGWNDPDSGRIFLDLSVVVPDQAAAEKLAQDHDQIAVFNLGSGETITVNKDATSGGQVNPTTPPGG